MNSIPVTFSDLTGSAVGQTVGSNITLDTNAAGHNWYIDTTPWDNRTLNHLINGVRLA